MSVTIESDKATTNQTNEVSQLEPQQTPNIDLELIEKVFQASVEKVGQLCHVPSSTYRVQFNRDFTFKQAIEQIDYLNRLGISDLYASPYFKARAESPHGYDIVNHNELNPAIGTSKDYDKMVDALHRRGMSQVLDTVPNHMGIGEEGNAWWMDVLENGRSSIYAPFFDIDWNPINTKLTNKVLLPLLGDQYGSVLENGELKLSFPPGEGRFCLNYYEHTFPINPRSYEDILSPNKDRLIQELGPESEAALEYQSILTSISHLPSRNETDLDRTLERNREKEVIKRRLAALCSSEPRVQKFIESNVEGLNGTPGEPRSFDMLDALLERQPYRLSFWRVATEEINYRRFFDVNELAAIRVDLPNVFEETHRMIMGFLKDGKLNGLRIDHVDGLLDPAGYFENLQCAYFLAVCRAQMENLPGDTDRTALEQALTERFQQERAANPASVLNKPLYVVVEKILARGESLPAGWVVYGTTGYEFTNAVNGLFVDTDNAKAMDEVYSSFIGEKVKFADLVYESKQAIMRLALSSEVTILTNMLNRISQADRHYRDFTISSIRNAIREVIACFPVYRTYVTIEQTEVDKRDRAVIETAVSRARKRNPAADPTIFDFLKCILLLEGQEDLSEVDRRARYGFVMKFQQVTGPVIAKGLEDTAFYIYNRLISLNEVGGEPDFYGISPAVFHKQQADRLRNWPHSILTTSTHDTKRSEDVRARINVISELPKEWRAAVRRWARLNRKHKKNVDGQLAPSLNEEYFLYQTLLGVWPFGEIDRAAHDNLVDRLQAYMRKALNEAKVNSSWINTNEPYLQAVSDFIADIVDRRESGKFLPDFLAFQQKVAHYGALSSLSQALIKITSPGVPDIYQGNETWDLSLVDPDNRRPVDYALRHRLLGQVERVKNGSGAARLLENMEDGRVKLLVTSRALRFRRDNPGLFGQGSYTPLEVEGRHSNNVLAFAREHEGAMSVTVAPYLLTKLAKAGEVFTPVGQAMAGSWLILPGVAAGQRFTDVLTGEQVEAKEHGGGAALALEEVLASFPVALLKRTKK